MDDITRQLVIEIKYRNTHLGPLREAQRAGKEMTRETRNHVAAAKELGRQFDTVANKILSTSKVAALIGAGAGVALGVSLVSAAREAENTRLAITTLVSSADSMVSGPFAGVNEAFAFSADLIKQMREEAISTPATFEGLRDSFRDVVVQARQAGASYSDIIKLSGDMSTMNKTLGFGDGVVSKDVQQLLRGEIGDINTPQLKAIRKEVQELHKAGKAAEQLKLIMAAVKVPEAIRAMQENSFDGALSSLQDEWSMFREEAGKPVLDYLTSEIKEVLKYVRENREAVKQWATEIGAGVLDAVKDVKAALVWMWDHREEIVQWAKMLVGGALLVKALGLVGDIVAGFKGLTAVFTGLAAHPFMVALLAAVAAVVALKQFVDDPEGTTIEQSSNLMGGALAVGAGLSSGLGALFGIDTVAEAKTLAAGVQKDRDTFFADREVAANAAEMAGYAAGEGMRQAHEYQQMLKTTKELSAWEAEINRQGIGGKGMKAKHKKPWEEGYVSLEDYIIDGLSMMPKPPQDAPSTPKPGDMNLYGTKITINQRVENTNPAQLARASLIDGFNAIVSKTISPRQRPGSVRLGNGG